MRAFVDPLAIDNGNKYQAKVNKTTNTNDNVLHLKRVAAIHLLGFCDDDLADLSQVDKVFGTWTRMLKMLEKEHPKLWELSNKVPEEEKPTIESKMEKAKTVVKADDEGDDGEDI